LIYSDIIILEYYVPAQCKNDYGEISIAYVVQGYKHIDISNGEATTGFGSSGSCQVNINCEEGQNWQEEKMLWHC